jgi:hypothetical protein
MIIKLNDANFQELVLNNRSEIVICVGTKEALSNPDSQQRMKAFEHNENHPAFMRHALPERTIGIVDSTDPESVETAARFKANLGSWLGRDSHPVETFIYDGGKHRFTMFYYIKAEEIYEKVVKCRQHPWGSIREEFNFLTKRTTIQLNDANFQELVLNNRSEIVICVGTKEALSNPDAQQRMRAFENHPAFRHHPEETTIRIVDSTDPESVETAARFKANLGSWLGRDSRPVETFIYDAGKHRFTMFYYIRAEEIYEKVIRCRQDPWASKGTNFMFIPNYNGRHSV